MATAVRNHLSAAPQLASATAPVRPGSLEIAHEAREEVGTSIRTGR